jgi:hypothetical protein
MVFSPLLLADLFISGVGKAIPVAVSIAFQITPTIAFQTFSIVTISSPRSVLTKLSGFMS